MIILLDEGMNRTSWKLIYILLSAAVVFVFANIEFIGVRSWTGSWDRMKLNTAMLVIAIVLVRYILAWIFKEKNNGWKAYCLLLLLSPILIEISFGIASTFLPPDAFHDFNLNGI